MSQYCRLRIPAVGLMAALATGVTASAGAQTSTPSASTGAGFEVFPGGSASRYHFKLDSLFYGSGGAADSARAALFGRLRAATSRNALVPNDANGLLALLLRADSLTGEFYRQGAYLSLRWNIDNRDGAAVRASDSLSNLFAVAIAPVTPSIAAISEDSLDSWRVQQPKLDAFRYYVNGLRRNASRALTPAEQRVLDETIGPSTAWQAGLFQAIVANSPYPPISTPTGERMLLRSGNELFGSEIRRVRADAYRVGREALLSRRELHAFGLINTVRGRNAVARARHFADFPEESYGERVLSANEVRTMLDRVAAASAVNERFERAQIAWIHRNAGYDTVHTWDLTMPERGMAPVRFTISDASRAIIASVRPLGNEYVREMTALLDPANGRLDLEPRANRSDRQGFSTGAVGFPSTFFQGRFEGFLPDVITFAHEAGHAVQNMLMTTANVRPLHSLGPGYFTESFASLSELLLLDELYKSASTDALRRTYLRQWLEQATGIFKAARESAFEQAIYDSVPRGRVARADDFERLMQHIGERYSLWFGDSARTVTVNDNGTSTTLTIAAHERPMEWVNALQFFTRPLYRVNYAYAELLGLAYFDRLERDPKGFTPRLGALLRNGYDDAPTALLQRFLGVRLDDPSLVREAMEAIERRVALYESLTAR